MSMLTANFFSSDKIRCGIAGACVLLASHAMAAGQAQPATVPAQPTGARENNAGTLQQVVVTAERRKEDVNKVPISMTALSGEALDELHIESLADVASVAPGISIPTPVSSSIAQTSVAIRGIFSGGNAPTTQIYIDDTPIAIRQLNAAGLSGSPFPLVFDLDRVEVLRGPQGTLFGSSAMGGAIRFITPQPNLTDSSGFAKADFGYTDGGATSYEVGLAYGAPIVADTAGFRVSGWFQSAGGFNDIEDPYSGDILKRNANSSDSAVFRPAFTWVPMKGLTITPALYIQHIHKNNPDDYWLTELPAPEDGGDASGVLEGQPSNDDLRISSLAITYDFDALSFQSNTSYLDREFSDIEDFTHVAEFIFSGIPVIPGLQSFVDVENDIDFTHQWQQEFRLSSQEPGSRVNWVAGAYYRNAVEGLTQLLPGDLSAVTEYCCHETSLQLTGTPNYVLNGQVLNGYTNFQTTDVEEALFGDVSVNIFSPLKADLGVRVEHSVVEHQNQLDAGPLDGGYSSVVLPDEVQNPVTPRLAVTYQFTDQDMVYVSAAKGYRAGGGNGGEILSPLCAPSLESYGLKSASDSFRSDSLWSYEVGSKDLLFNRRLSIQSSAYYIDWSNIQTGLGLPSCNLAFTANLGKAVSQGFDLQVAAIAAAGLRLSANVGYVDAYHPYAFFGAPSNGAPAPLLNGAGDKLPNVIPWTVALHAEYSRDISPVWPGVTSYIRVDYRWLDAAPALDPNVAGYDAEVGTQHRNPAYGVLNIRLGVLLPKGLDLSAYVFNATRSNPILGYDHDTSSDPLFYATDIRPLTVGVTGEYRF